MTPLCLHGYRFSVYTRIVRIVLLEKELEYAYSEVDPFLNTPEPALHPFGRVPTLTHGPATLYETCAITRYLDAEFDSPGLTPSDALSQARMMQVISIVDNYAYWPLVRQVFSHSVFRPIEGEASDPLEIEMGLKAAEPVLEALDVIAAEGRVLVPDQFTLASAHLIPMLDYFTRAPEGADALQKHPNLSHWLEVTQQRPSITATSPVLS
ncbi:glutathione S-transferase family protein [Roseovarius rhodophyticola]|uniref:glutathione transferase n=1 Tax=Roseovarius rhodophyticola TaxID=3080827 RepID=A0ABZ2THA2_9RHOB|nr:glutathione S-transferase family protein [Roseovarius sp. W115]MDV2929383.1 glutathione S-transferase family protein [Roseovarius sp. W115]